MSGPPHPSQFVDRAVAAAPAKRKRPIIVHSSGSESDDAVDDADTANIHRLIERVDLAAERANKSSPVPGGVAQWRALILTVGDRWGIGRATAGLRALHLHSIVKEVQATMRRLRTKLASRDDTQRVQAQRIIRGPSMLSITRSRSPVHNAPLNGLLAAAIHPTFGIPSVSVSSIDAIPLKLPGNLQPVLPTLPNRTTDATAINALLASIFACIGDASAAVNPEIKAFVSAFELDTAAGFARFGGLPAVWSADVGFETVIPDVPEGSVIMWKTWHATGGAEPGLGPKLVAFMDMVPRHFLTTAEYTWYEYCTRNAPVDPGAGSSRGAWQAMVHAMASGPPAGGYGLSTAGWSKVGDGAGLPADARRQLMTAGYTVVTPPPALVAAAPAAESARNFQTFFRNISGYPLDLSATDGVGSIAYLFAEEGKKTGPMRNRLQRVLADAPFAVNGGERSGTAQGGGAFITASAGMGSGTTYCNEPVHVRFQTSAWAASIMAMAGGDFYRGELIPVWERFRLKDSAAWSANTHVDTRIDTMIPAAAAQHIAGVRRVAHSDDL